MSCPDGCTCRRHYDNRHKAIYRVRGKAADYPCVECAGTAREWAQVHGTDGSDPHDHYRPMCVKCHRNYDGWGAISSASKKRYWAGVPVEERNRSPETRRKNSEANKRRWATMPEEQRKAIFIKIANSQRGKPKSPAAVENMRRIRAERKAERLQQATEGVQ